jgi:Na+/H+-dicarboxylate symporter
MESEIINIELINNTPEPKPKSQKIKHFLLNVLKTLFSVLKLLFGLLAKEITKERKFSILLLLTLSTYFVATYYLFIWMGFSFSTIVLTQLHIVVFFHTRKKYVQKYQKASSEKAALSVQVQLLQSENKILEDHINAYE